MIVAHESALPLQEVPELIPARMLNEFAYCPRLAYLEWVQGEFADNLETREGRFAHRRVDRPSGGAVPEAAELAGLRAPAETDAGRAVAASASDSPISSPRRHGGHGEAGGATVDPSGTHGAPSSGTHGVPSSYGDEDDGVKPEHETIHTRSIMLSAPAEGLIAKLDLLDLSAAEAVPIEYKRGRLPECPGNAWEPEQVQLCAQGLILRANGYHCEAGILYYVDSRRRVSVPFDESLVDRTRELLAQLRSTAASQKIPPPLEESAKCPRCSLVGICLPDETRLLAEPAPREAGAPRRLLPARDDALPMYVQEQGVSVGKSGEVLTVSRRGEVLSRTKLIDVSQVCVFGNAQISAQAIRDVSAAGIPICHFSYGGWFHALTTGLVPKNVELRMAQFAAAADGAVSLSLARQIVAGKIKNARTLLRRHLEEADGLLFQLQQSIQSAESAHEAASLLGIEGMAARTYFSGFARLLRGGPEFNIEGRNRRPPRDPVNALLSFLYAILVKDMAVTLHAVGFDPMLGFYHRPRYGRPSLALDLAEPFRPLIADSVALTMVNNGEVNAESFVRRAGGVALTAAGRRAVLAAYERRMDTLVTHPLFGYRISYRRILEVQARLLARTLSGEIPEYPVFCTR